MLDRRLELFIKVAENGSMTDTANSLFVSQPAVSKQIKSLEEELNVKLFYRDKRNGLILTDIGEKMLVLAKQAADIDNRMYQEAFRENNFIGGKLRIASLPILSSTLLALTLPIYKKNYPYVNIEIIEGSPREIRKMILEHSVDIALSCSPFEELDYEILVHDKMIGLFPSDAKDIPKSIDLNAGTDNMILCKAGSETVLEELGNTHNIDFSKALLFENPATVVNMVQNKNGIGVLSEFTLASIQNNLKTCSVTPFIPIEIGIEAISMDDLTPVASRFCEILRDSIAHI